MKEKRQEMGSKGITGFDTCARPQGVIKSGLDGDSSEGDSLGAFILDAVAIMVFNDFEEVKDGSFKDG